MNTNNTLVDFTDAAAEKVWSLIEEEANFNLNLRVFITGGGCAGFQYGFTFDEKINEDDIIVDKPVKNNTLINPADGQDTKTQDEDADDQGDSGTQSNALVKVKLLIDPLSFQYLKGATINYRKDVSGEHFVISNPNAKTTCGCGSSFAA